MGRPDQGNKALIAKGYSHGTWVSIGGLVTASTGLIPRVTLGVGGLCRFLGARAVRVGWEVAQQDGRRVELRPHPRRSGGREELLTEDDWCSRGGVGTAHEPQKEISEGAEASPGPGTDIGGYKGRSRGPRTGYWGTHGANGDSVAGVLGEAWRY